MVKIKEGTYLKRAKTQDLKTIFNKYASTVVDGEQYMTSEDFIRRFLGLFPSTDYNKKSVELLSGILDTSKDGLISFQEFQNFEGLLCIPDAVYKTAFRFFDTSGNGYVSFEEFREIITHTTHQKKIPFNLQGRFVSLYFGKDKKRLVTYEEFMQFLHDFHEEWGNEAFRTFDDTSSRGSVKIEDFCTIMRTLKRYVLTDDVSKQLENLANAFSREGRISYPFFVATNRLLNNMELVKKVYLLASKNKRDTEISKEELIHASQLMSQISPLEIEILFYLCEAINKSPTIIYSDLQSVAPELYYKKVTKKILDIKVVESEADRGLFVEFLESAYRFVIGSAAGAVGAIVVYPMDLVKTRMQNQRPIPRSYTGIVYDGNWDCFKKSYAKEGFRGLYRGLTVQGFGVAFGKAFKLAINDFVRDHTMNQKGVIPFWGEVFAGGCAGVVSALITSPLEMIKIRIQVAGEIGVKKSSWGVLKDIRFRGLFTGMTCALWRDIPFHAVFFPAYAHMKLHLQDENGYNSPLSVLIAGAVASLPCAPLQMPLDVIKTRLQVKPRPKQTTYTGIVDAFKKILNEESPRSLWQGARLIKPSTQFGITLLMYEVLQRWFYVDFAGNRPVGSEGNVLITDLTQIKSLNPDHLGGYAVALPILSGIETKFGLILPQNEIK